MERLKRLVLAAAAVLSSSPAVAQAPIELERSTAGERGAMRLAERPARDVDLDLLIEAGPWGRPGNDPALQRPATFGINLVALGRLADSVRVGSGVGYHRASAPASLRASNASGATGEVLLIPGMVTVPVVMKLALGGVEAVLEPALVVGWVTGTIYRSGTTRLDYDSSPGLGAQLAAGLDLRIMGPVSFSFRAGIRALRPSLVGVRAFVAQGPPEQLAHPEAVDVDLSGPFWNVGLSLRL